MKSRIVKIVDIVSLKKKKLKYKMADSIKVVVLENDFAVLCRLGLPVSLSLQLQQSGLKLADALWTARSSGSGFSVSLFWPSDIRTSKWEEGREKL